MVGGVEEEEKGGGVEGKEAVKAVKFGRLLNSFPLP